MMNDECRRMNEEKNKNVKRKMEEPKFFKNLEDSGT
jgi:hypothetical protein